MSSGASEGDFDLSGPEILDRSSADFDHALRDIDRRSPIPLLDGVKDLDDDGVVGREGTGSNIPTFGRERSKTDLGSSISTNPNTMANRREHWSAKRTCLTAHRNNIEKRDKHGDSPASTTNIIVSTHRRGNRPGVCGMGNLGLSGKRTRA